MKTRNYNNNDHKIIIHSRSPRETHVFPAKYMCTIAALDIGNMMFPGEQRPLFCWSNVDIDTGQTGDRRTESAIGILAHIISTVNNNMKQLLMSTKT